MSNSTEEGQTLRSCPSCGGGTFQRGFSDVNRRHGLPGLWTYVRCSACGTLWLRPTPSPTELVSAYQNGEVDRCDYPAELDVTFGAEHPGFSRRVLRRVSELLTARPHSWPDGPGAGRSLLDFGCLRGHKLREFHERGWAVTGIDLNARAIDYARRILPQGRFYAGSAADIPQGEMFDVIRIDNVLEHLPSPSQTLCELRRHLRMDGRIFVYVPNAEAPSVRLLKGYSCLSWCPYHLQLFTGRGLKSLFARSGFTEVKVFSFTPLSWWELTMQQLVAPPGFALRPPKPAERLAALSARPLAPLWLLLAKLRLGEELIVSARA